MMMDPTWAARCIVGVRIVDLKINGDSRGYFLENYRKDWLNSFAPVQSNFSFSQANVLRGMHFHKKQTDFWVVPDGLVTVALYDMRPSSLTLNTHAMFQIGTKVPYGVLIPPGVAHGFYANEPSVMTYQVDQYYDNTDEFGINWADPDLCLTWPTKDPFVSKRDSQNPSLKEIRQQMGIQ